MSLSKVAQKRKRNKLPSNIKLTISFLADIEKAVRNLLTDILFDYAERFNVKIREDKVRVAVIGAEGAKKASPHQLGVTIVDDDGNILVDLRDPSLDAKDSSHTYVHYLFMEVICHEFVHVAQYLTTARTFTWNTPNHNLDDKHEKYFFDQQEIEARVLADFYAAQYGSELLSECCDMESD